MHIFFRSLGHEDSSSVNLLKGWGNIEFMQILDQNYVNRIKCTTFSWSLIMASRCGYDVCGVTAGCRSSDDDSLRYSLYTERGGGSWRGKQHFPLVPPPNTGLSIADPLYVDTYLNQEYLT